MVGKTEQLIFNATKSVNQVLYDALKAKDRRYKKHCVYGLKTRFDRIIEDLQTQDIQGDELLNKIIEMFFHGFGARWSSVQQRIFNAVIDCTLPRIYGNEWHNVKERVLMQRKLARLKQEMLILMARRNGKTFGTAGIAATLWLTVPGIKIAIFSVSERQSKMMLSEIKKLIEMAWKKGTHVTKNQFTKKEENKESINYIMNATGTEQSILSLPGSVRVSYHFFIKTGGCVCNMKRLREQGNKPIKLFPANSSLHVLSCLDVVRMAQYRCYKSMIESGADVNERSTTSGSTLLELIVNNFNGGWKKIDYDMIEFLLSRKADILRDGVSSNQQVLYAIAQCPSLRKRFFFSLSDEHLRYIFPDYHYSLLDVILRTVSNYTLPFDEIYSQLLEKHVPITAETLRSVFALLTLGYPDFPQLLRSILKEYHHQDPTCNLLCEAFICWTLPRFNVAAIKLSLYCMRFPKFTLQKIFNRLEKSPIVDLESCEYYKKLRPLVTALDEKLTIYASIPGMTKDIWKRIILQSCSFEMRDISKTLTYHGSVLFYGHIIQIIKAPWPLEILSTTYIQNISDQLVDRLEIWLENGGVWPKNPASVLKETARKNKRKLEYIARILHTDPDKEHVQAAIKSLTL